MADRGQRERGRKRRHLPWQEWVNSPARHSERRAHPDSGLRGVHPLTTAFSLSYCAAVGRGLARAVVDLRFCSRLKRADRAGAGRVRAGRAGDCFQLDRFCRPQTAVMSSGRTDPSSSAGDMLFWSVSTQRMFRRRPVRPASRDRLHSRDRRTCRGRRLQFRGAGASMIEPEADC